jgi:cyclopropane fatty-acyl-phospholipid synthase-like methyltransferase
MHKKIFDLFCGLPRGGPGNEGCTIRALRIVSDLVCSPKVLDAGCGVGASTLVIARNLDCQLTAIDTFEKVIEILQKKITDRGLETRVKALVHDMGNPEGLGKKFDLIWSEGAVYNLGFENGLKTLARALNPRGYIAVTEMTLLEDAIPDEVKAYMDKYYPAVTTIEGNLEIIKKCGLSEEGHFVLPESAWSDDFYTPMAEVIPKYREENESGSRDSVLEEELRELEEEIDFYHKYSRYFGYVFYVMRKM